MPFYRNRHAVLAEFADGEQFYLTSSTGSSNIDFDLNDDLQFVTLRCELGGVPVGVPRDNCAIINRIRYGDLYGCMNHVFDDYNVDYYSIEADMLVDYVYYNYDCYLVEDSNSEVIPLDQCISNSINGVIQNAQVYTNHYCRVYAAELVYIPFSVNCVGLDDYDFDVYFVPVWALYTFCYGGGAMLQAETSVVYLNAITGELFSRGL